MSLRLNKPYTYSGERDSVGVRAWIYQVEKYLELIEIGGAVGLNDATKIKYAASFFSEASELWWYSIFEANFVVRTWQNFKTFLIAELVPLNFRCEAPNKLKVLRQQASVEEYVTDFRNTALPIPNIADG